MKLRKGDKVLIRSGKDKGKTGTILRVLSESHQVVVENVNMVKRAYKPSAKHPKGGIRDEARPIWASKVGIVHPKDSKRSSRIGYAVAKDGKKQRVYRQAGGATIKDQT